MGQLLQRGGLRHAHRACRGGSTSRRRTGPSSTPRTSSSTRRSSTSRSWDLVVFVLLVFVLPRPARAGAGRAVPDLPRALLRRPLHHRGAPHRRAHVRAHSGRPARERPRRGARARGRAAAPAPRPRRRLTAVHFVFLGSSGAVPGRDRDTTSLVFVGDERRRPRGLRRQPDPEAPPGRGGPARALAASSSRISTPTTPTGCHPSCRPCSC